MKDVLIIIGKYALIGLVLGLFIYLIYLTGSSLYFYTWMTIPLLIGIYNYEMPFKGLITGFTAAVVTLMVPLWMVSPLNYTLNLIGFALYYAVVFGIPLSLIGVVIGKAMKILKDKRNVKKYISFVLNSIGWGKNR